MEVTEILAAKTIATKDNNTLTATIQLPLPTRRDSRPALLKLCLYKGQTREILRNLRNANRETVVTPT